jgi:hypothetical protein
VGVIYDKTPEEELSGDRFGGLGAGKVSVPCTVASFQAVAHPETASYPNGNGVVPHSAGRVNSQESPPSHGAMTTVPACLGMSSQ